MTDTSQLRLLPWRSPDGKPCYLSSSNPHSRFSRLADEVEEEQIECGNAVLEGAQEVLADDWAKFVKAGLPLDPEQRYEQLFSALDPG